MDLSFFLHKYIETGIWCFAPPLNAHTPWSDIDILRTVFQRFHKPFLVVYVVHMVNIGRQTIGLLGDVNPYN